MNTRIHITRQGERIVQRENVGVDDASQHRWRMVAGPYSTPYLARQGEQRYRKKVERNNPNRLAQQVISRNWGDVEIKY